MNILFEIADKDLIFIVLGVLALILFISIIFFAVKKGKRVKPLDESERFDLEDELEEEPRELTEEQMKAKAELERVFNQMSADLKEAEEPKNTIEEFEREQEENAIISYQELIKQAAKKEEDNSHLDSNERPRRSVVQEQLNFDDESEKEPKKEEVKKFRNSDIISPIFGIQPEGRHVKQNPVSVRKPLYDENVKAAQSENNSDFLNSLKEFRKNL